MTSTVATSAVRRLFGGRSLLGVLFEVVLISAGVFLAVAADQWRENRARSSAAQESLRRFQSEIETNRKSVLAVHDYHTEKLKKLGEYFKASADEKGAVRVNMQGLRPVFFEHSAWDLSLATQSLADIDSNLAFALARIYNAQDTYAELSGGIMQALYNNANALQNDSPAFMAAAEIYFNDVTRIEPELVKMYDEVAPKIVQALDD